MADSAALRMRRSRSHKAGDHSLCRHDCANPPAAALAAEPPQASPLERLDALAGRLEAAHQAEPGNAIVARELRLTLEALAKAEPVTVDVMGELRDLAAKVS